MKNEKIGSEHCGIRTEEEIQYFSRLVEELNRDYDMEVNEDAEFIILKTGAKDIYVPKWKKIPTKDGQLVSVQDIIQDIIKENNIKKRDKKEAA